MRKLQICIYYPEKKWQQFRIKQELIEVLPGHRKQIAGK
jgi:hypothetical protein